MPNIERIISRENYCCEYHSLLAVIVRGFVVCLKYFTLCENLQVHFFLGTLENSPLVIQLTHAFLVVRCAYDFSFLFVTLLI